MGRSRVDATLGGRLLVVVGTIVVSSRVNVRVGARLGCTRFRQDVRCVVKSYNPVMSFCFIMCATP